MQTFLPYPSFEKSVQCLDNKRLNKQIVEAMQIETAILNNRKGIKSGWQSHPCCIMWYNFLPALRAYRYYAAKEYELRTGKIHSCSISYQHFESPTWLGELRLHISHQSNLYRKDPDYYARFKEHGPSLEYWWPRVSEQVYPTSSVMAFPSGKSGTLPFDKLKYPRLISPKHDGTYCLIYNGELYSRKLKLIPNNLYLDYFLDLIVAGKEAGLVIMGELLSGNFHESQSTTRSYSGDISDATRIMVFDCMKKEAFDKQDGWLTFQHRRRRYEEFVRSINRPFVDSVEQILVQTPQQARSIYEAHLEAGLEGSVTRDPDAYYKFGRTTRLEHNLFRHTEFTRTDVVVIDIMERLQRKDGVQVPRLLDGKAHRSFKQDDYEGSGIAGSLRVRDGKGRVFNCGFGKGWDHQSLRLLWAGKEKYVGKIAEIEYKTAGEKDLPRQPKLIRFRDDKDEPTYD